ncbi:GGDEF domain-containing protein [Croceicoccus naphthovorans]|nr:GGDEF domain-containing protein [Croceicoccus naphthovorans]MBB3991692.1 diguanylate cyclase (GGDEF)-like protein [Croceicoccus naphthovorans]
MGLDAFDYVVLLSREHENWELDEILTTLMVLPMAISVVAVRRLKDALRELSIRVEAERTANDLALRDPLTQLPNRRAFSQLASEFAECGRERPFLLVLLDLNRFKAVNDLRGHVAGDQLLVGVAERLTRITNIEATVARLGGDEFVVLIPDVGNDAQEQRWLQRLSACFDKPFTLGDHQVSVGASMGARRVNEKCNDVEILLNQADAAMYRCKSRRANAFCVFQPGMEQASILNASVAEQLRLAA